MRRLFLLVLIISGNIYAVPFLFAETIVLQNGETIEGKIIERKEGYIKVERENKETTYFLNYVESINNEPVSSLGSPGVSKESLAAKELKNIFEKISPAIVYIVNKREKTTGIGFILEKKGVIITNCLVASWAKEISVQLKDGRAYPVRSAMNNAELDVCFLKIDVDNLPAAVLGDSHKCHKGDTVYSIGHTAGIESAPLQGTVSAIRQEVNVNYLEVTAPITEGDVGSLIVNSQGEVVGIVTASAGKNIHFALAVNEIKPVIKQLLEMKLKDLKIKDLYKTPKVSMREARRAALSGDFDEAGIYYTQTIEGKADQNITYVAYVGRAYAYFNNGELDMALDDIQKAIEIAPRDWRAYILREMISVQKKDYGAALSDCNKIIKLSPKMAYAYQCRSFIFSLQKEYDKAISDANKSIEFDPSASAYASRGCRYFEKGSYAQALSDFSRAIEWGPDDDTQYLIALMRQNIYFEQGAYEQAFTECNKAIKIFPQKAAAYNARAKVYFKKGNYNRAWDDVRKAEALGMAVSSDFLKELKRASAREK